MIIDLCATCWVCIDVESKAKNQEINHNLDRNSTMLASLRKQAAPYGANAYLEFIVKCKILNIM